MNRNATQDTVVGLFVAAGIAALFFLALQVSNLSAYSQQDSYTVTARFENSGGLKVKSPVSAAGVRIGRVSDIHFDQEKSQSIVVMAIDAKYDKLPDDTTASIFTAGLLGEQYVSLEPGGSEEFLHNNSIIEITQSAVILEKVLGQFLFKAAEEKAEEKKVSRLFLTDEGNGVFSVEGNLTFATIDKQTVKSFDFLTSNKIITIDLGGVECTDSAGLALMIEWIKFSRLHKTRLHFKNIPDQLKHLAQLSGFDKTTHFSVSPDAESHSTN